MTIHARQVRLGAGLHNIRAGCLGTHHAVAECHTQAHLTHGILADGNRLQREIQQAPLHLGQPINGLERRIHRPVTAGRILQQLATFADPHGGCGDSTRTRRHMQIIQRIKIVRVFHLLTGNHDQVVVIDHLLLIRQRDEALICLHQFFIVQRNAYALQRLSQTILSREFAQHQLRPVMQPNVCRVNDLIGRALLDHTVLVNPRRMRECIGSHDGLVTLDRHTGQATNQATDRDDLLRIDTRVQFTELIGPRLQRHHDLFQCRITGTLAQTINGAFNLPRAAHGRGQRIRHRQAQIIVTMHTDHGIIDVRHRIVQACNHRTELLRHAVTHGIRNIDRVGACINGRFHNLRQEVSLRTRGILRAELHILAERTRIFYRGNRLLNNLGARLAQLKLAVNGRRGEEHVNSRLLRRRHGFGTALNIRVNTACQPAYRRPFYLFRNSLNRGEITGRGNRKPGLNHIHAQRCELQGNLQLFAMVQAGTGRLFAIAQRRIKYSNSVLISFFHDSSPTKSPPLLPLRWASFPTW